MSRIAGFLGVQVLNRARKVINFIKSNAGISFMRNERKNLDEKTLCAGERSDLNT